MPIDSITASELLVGDLLETRPGDLDLVTEIERDDVAEIIGITLRSTRKRFAYSVRVRVDHDAHVQALAIEETW